MNQSGRPPDDGSISPSSSQIFTPFPLTPRATPSLGSNAATKVGPLDASDDTLDPNRRLMTQSFTPPFHDVAEYSLRPEGGDPS